MLKNIILSKSFFILFIIFIHNIEARDPSFTDRKKYPNRKSLKGIHPDYTDVNQIIGNQVHDVAIDFKWSDWQPTLKKSICSSDEVMFIGLCYKVNINLVNMLKAYTDSDVMITGLLYGVPSWARRSCLIPKDPVWCAPTEEGTAYFGLFCRFIANYFNGENGHGRVANFVIHNEVNAVEWFNYGCNNGNCDVDLWTTVYAKSFNTAYDFIIQEQPNAKVLIPFQHDFYKELDYEIASPYAVISVETFLEHLIPKLEQRKWRLAYHSYPPSLLVPEFGSDDYPLITFGNIGALAGWLRMHYPNNPESWEIQLTENGLNARGSSMYEKQKNYLCQAFKNIIGTPGIESFLYHRLIDNEVELKDGLALGLWSGPSVSTMKPSWELFALANRNDIGKASCGFELLPYVEMTIAFNGNYHYISTRNLPAGFVKEKSFKIKREKDSEDMVLVFECRVGGPKGKHSIISVDYKCENNFNMGPMGYLYNTKVSNSVPIYRCLISSNSDHFITTDSNCDGKGIQEALMGYGFLM